MPGGAVFNAFQKNEAGHIPRYRFSSVPGLYKIHTFTAKQLYKYEFGSNTAKKSRWTMRIMQG